MKINLISEWGNVVSNVRNNIVFEHRNQAYGAYFIRREYPRTMFFSLFLTVSVIALGVASLKLSSILFPKEVPFEIPQVISCPIIEIPIELKPLETLPVKMEPLKTPPAPKGTEFTAPIASDDKEKIDDTPPSQEEIKPGVVDGVDNDTAVFIPEIPKGNGTVVVIEKDPAPFTHVEIMPEFVGGEGEMLRFINAKLKYPKIELENNITGTVYASFVVDKSGNITNVKIERGVKGGPNFDKEVERVIKLMPVWNPGKQNGVAVPVQFFLPVKFETR